MRRLRLAAAVALGLLAPAPALALTAVTTGALDLKVTFRCISVRAAFTQDDNANATATIRYKKSSDGTWKLAYPPIVDRRAAINRTANPYVNEARGSIVGLDPNTSYDVEVTWSDPDGVSGTNPRTGTITTLSYDPPLPGTTKYVDPAARGGGNGTQGSPYNSIATAISNTVAGDTIILRAGTYPQTTISTSGTSRAWRRLIAFTGETPTFGSASGDVLTMNANFWVLDGLHFNTSVNSTIRIGTNAHHVFVQNSSADDIGTSGNIGNAFVSIGPGANNVYVVNNTAVRVTTAGLAAQHENDGVYFLSNSSHSSVIEGNSLTGNFWDGIGNAGNSSLTTNENTDYANNTINGYTDDSIEMDGGSVNARAWGNIVITSPNRVAGPNSVFSEAGTIVGPSYIFRNVLTSTRSISGVKQGGGGVGYCFFFHNTVETSGRGGNEALGCAGGPACPILHVYKNNILKSTGHTIDKGSSQNTYDHNLSYRPNGVEFAAAWNGKTSYTTLTTFQAGTGQEAHGKDGNPNFTDSAKHIDATSPAYESGVILANFNTRDSIWGYTGRAPDMGAYEVGGFTSDAPAKPDGPGQRR